MTTIESPTTAGASTTEPSETRLRDWYAQQMRLLDDGQVEAWAQTFTEDAEFVTPAKTATGRGLIARLTGYLHNERASRGVVHRHLQTCLLVESDDASTGELICSSYVLVVQAQAGGPPTIHVSSVCRDRLRRSGDSFLVTRRQVIIDGVE